LRFGNCPVGKARLAQFRAERTAADRLRHSD
jgi:hypothetical protein